MRSKLTDRTVPHDPGWEEYIYICDKKPREERENEGEMFPGRSTKKNLTGS